MADGGRVDRYLPRIVDRLLDRYLAELSAVMLVGPRACGKTTTALRRAASVVRLDVPDEVVAFRAAPDAILAARKPPVLIDEWQVEPESLGAVRRAVDSGQGAGRYLVTGSVRARRSGGPWPGTGRVVPVEMHPLTTLEIEERTDLLPADPIRTLAGWDTAFSIDDHPSLPGYVERAVIGGFPNAVGLSASVRNAWYEGYAEQLVYRDASQVESIRSPERLMRLLRAIAINSAGTPTDASLSAAADLDVRTTRSYLDLLDDLRIVHRVPAWHNNRLSRLVKAPKYYITDTGLAASLAGIDVDGLLRSGDLLGRMVDTFVAAQLRPLGSFGPATYTMSHLRDRGGDHEVDIILENRAGELVAIEVKAAGRVSSRDARHLAWLRDRMGDRFLNGIVLHTGSSGYPLGDRLIAAPVAALWTWPEPS